MKTIFFRPRLDRLGEQLQPHVAELHLHRRTGVDLQGDDAVLAGDRVLVGHLAHQLPVDLLDNVVSAGDDVVLVPTVSLDDLGEFAAVAELLDDLRPVVGADHGFLAALGEDAAVILAVANARVVVVAVHVGLVAADLPLARAFPTADLDARVGEARIRHAELGLDLEIGGLAAAPNEERVRPGGVFLRRLAGDRAVLDAPEPGIAVPAGERFAVEDRLEPFLGRRGLPCRRQQQAKHRSESEMSQTFHRCFS